ncbi:MAG: polyisoprenoid-binding protein [Verrucomicrobiae bacterium]|nr:polyisoprenoid-binding protein [Verrucomicrobiae bacterium]
MKTSFLLPAVAVVAFAAATQAADLYRLDPVHSTLGFAVDHLVISKVHGRFKSWEATLSLDPAAGNAPVAAHAVIQTASVDTAVEARDKDLRSPNFFDAEKFPEIRFDCSRFEKEGGRYVAVGNFTMHGVTKEIRLPFTLKGPIQDPWGKTRVALEARMTLNRRDYGLTYSKALETGGLVVGNEVFLEINAEAVKEPAAKQRLD